MVDFTKFGSARLRLGLGGAALLVLGAVGGATAIGATRPAIEMAPTSVVAIASLPQHDGLVTVRGKVAEVYGDRFTVADATGKTMVDAGRGANTMTVGAAVLVQGRYDNGQLRASFVVDASGNVTPVGPGGRHGPRPEPGGPGRGGPSGMRGDGPEGCPPPPPGVRPAVPAPASAGK